MRGDPVVPADLPGPERARPIDDLEIVIPLRPPGGSDGARLDLEVPLARGARR